MYAGFDFQSPVSMRHFINALDYIYLGGNNLDHTALRALGNTPEEIYSRRQIVQEIILRMRNDNAFLDQITQFRSAYWDRDTQLLAAADVLLAFPVAPIGVVAGPSTPSDVATGSSSMTDCCYFFSDGRRW